MSDDVAKRLVRLGFEEGFIRGAIAGAGIVAGIWSAYSMGWLP